MGFPLRFTNLPEDDMVGMYGDSVRWLSVALLVVTTLMMFVTGSNVAAQNQVYSCNCQSGGDVTEAIPICIGGIT